MDKLMKIDYDELEKELKEMKKEGNDIFINDRNKALRLV